MIRKGFILTLACLALLTLSLAPAATASASPREIIVFNPTPKEFEACTRHVKAAKFKNFTVRTVLTGPGKINATYKVTEELLPLLKKDKAPFIIIGAGTSGSLSKKLKSGDIAASAKAFITDWQMVEDHKPPFLSPYDELDFKSVNENTVERLLIECNDPLITELMAKLAGVGFKVGRFVSSDTFVAGLKAKLEKGATFNALVCDMESGTFGYLANKKFGGIPWFNLRVVADTIDHNFADYVEMEEDMTDILGRRLVEALTILDSMIE